MLSYIFYLFVEILTKFHSSSKVWLACLLPLHQLFICKQLISILLEVVIISILL